MKIFVDKDVVDVAANTEQVVDLHRLFSHACEGRHLVFGDFESWFSTIGPETAKYYRSAANTSIRRATTTAKDTSTVHIKLQPSGVFNDPVAELSLPEAVRLLNEPLGLIVENGINDWNFLRKIATNNERFILDESKEKGWLSVIHGGGNDILKSLEERATNPYRRLRSFALFDSDRYHPDELHASWTPPSNVTCTGYSIEQAAARNINNRYWRLKRRYIESYLPKSELKAHEEENRNIPEGATDALFRMPESSRWYFNIKGGFAKSNSNEAPVRQGNLFSAVPAQDRQLLSVGFGRAGLRYTSSQVAFSWDDEARSEAAANLPLLLRLL